MPEFLLGMSEAGRDRFLRCVLALGLLAGPGCRRPEAPPRPVRIAAHSEPLSFDPHLHNEILTFAVLTNLYEGLTRFDARLRAAPGLAESWENPDERTWRFRLRTNARFHDGRPVEAEDVVASIERARSRPDGRLGSYLVEVESAVAEGPRTVVLRTRRPSAVLLNKLTYIYVVPRDSPERIESPVGSGPYRLTAFEKGKRVRLEAAPGARTPEGAVPPPLEFLPISDPAERAAALFEGRADVVQDLLAEALPRARAAPNLRVSSRPSTGVEHLVLSLKEKRFADPRVRRAIHVALDRRKLVQDAHAGEGQPASQMVGPGVFGYDPRIALPEPDRALARRLLAEAGYPRGFDVDLEFRHGRRGDLVAAQLKEIGLRVTPKAGLWSEVFPRFTGGKIGFYLGGVVAVTADASDIFDSFAHTKIGAYGRTNFIAYSNRDLDVLIERSGEILDMSARRGVLQAAMRTLMEDLRFIPLLIPNDVYGMSADLEWEPRLDRLFVGAEMRWKK